MWDWIAALLTVFASSALVYLGLFQPPFLSVRLGPAAILFGAIGVFLGLGDIRQFVSPSPDRKEWLRRHITGMLASYIAALTAFSVTALAAALRTHSIVLWLWPTVIGTPLIVYFVNRYAGAGEARMGTPVWPGTTKNSSS